MVEVITDMKAIIEEIRKRKFRHDEYVKYCVEIIAISIQGYPNSQINDGMIKGLKKQREQLNDILSDIKRTVILK